VSPERGERRFLTARRGETGNINVPMDFGFVLVR